MELQKNLPKKSVTEVHYIQNRLLHLFNLWKFLNDDSELKEGGLLLRVRYMEVTVIQITGF